MKNIGRYYGPGFSRVYPITTVFTDAIWTIFSPPLREQNVISLMVEVAKVILGKKLPWENINLADFEKYLNKLRTNCAVSGRFSPNEQAGPAYWGAINAAVLNHFGCVCTVEQGEKISEALRNETKTFVIPKVQREFFSSIFTNGFGGQFARGGCRSYVATNSDRCLIKGLLVENKAESLFANVITPSEVRSVVKPDPRYFERILQMTKANPEKSLFIGNSVYKDLVAARFGIWTILLDRRHTKVSWEEIHSLHGPEACKRIIIVNSFTEAVSAINEHFYTAKQK